MADKRKTGRIIKRLHTTFLCGEKEYRGISSNFSLTGVFIKSRKKFKPGSSLNITLDLGDNQKIALIGEIAWVKSSKPDRVNKVQKVSTFDKFNEGMGIKLNETPQEFKEFLKVLIKEQL
ncbi:MAG: PilZ domain-containing protein [Candidatus Hodarchaeales archaeon]|jgi:Tfp pilus assembly protein PilZ